MFNIANAMKTQSVKYMSFLFSGNCKKYINSLIFIFVVQSLLLL